MKCLSASSDYWCVCHSATPALKALASCRSWDSNPDCSCERACESNLLTVVARAARIELASLGFGVQAAALAFARKKDGRNRTTIGTRERPSRDPVPAYYSLQGRRNARDGTRCSPLPERSVTMVRSFFRAKSQVEAGLQGPVRLSKVSRGCGPDWLGREESNLRKRHQKPLSCR